jgi:hypothetical protein
LPEILKGLHQILTMIQNIVHLWSKGRYFDTLANFECVERLTRHKKMDLRPAVTKMKQIQLRNMLSILNKYTNTMTFTHASVSQHVPAGHLNFDKTFHTPEKFLQRLTKISTVKRL